MARLPTVGADKGSWGSVLNDYLSVSHESNGTLKTGAVNSGSISDNSITTAKLVDGSVTAPKLSPANPSSGQLLSYDGTNLDWVDPVNAGDPTLGGDLTGTASNAQLAAGVVGQTELASNAVTTAKILDANVTTAKIADSSVTTAKILDANVTTSKLANSSVDSAKLDTTATPTSGQVLSYNGTDLAWTNTASSNPTVGGDLSGTVSNAQLVAGAVGATELASNAVTTVKIASSAVTNDKLSSGAVSAIKIATDAVVTAGIQDAAVTEAKLSGAVQTKLNAVNNSVTVSDAGAVIGTRPNINFVEGSNVTITTTDDSVNNRVNVNISSTGSGGTADASTSTKGIVQLAGDLGGAGTSAAAPLISANAISTGKIADTAVTSAKLASNAVTTSKILDANVTTAKIADNSVTSSKLDTTVSPTNGQVLSYDGTDLTWTNGLSSNPAVGGDLSGTISNAQIVASAVGATELASNAVTTAKVLDANITTAKLADSSVTTAKILDANVTTAKLANSSVDSAKLDTTVSPTSGQILSYNGTDLTWTNAASSNPSVGGDLSGTVSSAQIVANAVGATELASNAVTTAKVLDANITTAKIADNSVTEPKLSVSNAPGTNQVLTWTGADLAWVTPSSGGGSADSWRYNVKDYGAVGNGSTDDSVAIKACIAAAVATKGSGTAPVRAEVVFPPGNYYVTQNDTLFLASDGSSTNGVQGLKIRGFGKEVTKITFNPSTTSGTDGFVGNLFSANKRARFFHISDMSIASQNSQANAFYFYQDGGGSHMNQGCIFERIHFSGNWQRCFGFDGPSTANLNSEMTFRSISGATATYSDAFFRVGGISGTFNQQNQFLDYWFYDSFFILDGGTLFKFDKGGAVHIVNGSWSAASSSSPAMTFISMPNSNYNNTSAAQFHFSGIRFEPKASNHRIIDCSLGQGSVRFESCVDLSSIQNSASYEYPLHRYVGGNPWGFGVIPTVRYVNCHMTGYHLYEGPAVARGRFIYDGCYFFRGTGGQMANATQVESSAEPVLRWTSGAPLYSFRDNWNITDVAT